MKEILQEYAMYNLWANKRMTAAILDLDEGLHQQHVDSSFPNLYATVLHMWDAESVWFQRIKLHERILKPSETFNPSMKETVNGLLSQSQQWEDFSREVTENKLQHVFEYRNTHKELLKQPVYQVMLHVFNHGTYHRGQLVTMMRVLGQQKIPSTDFAIWARKK